MKRFLLIALLPLAILLTPGQAQAAKSCGNVTDPKGNEWQIATANVPCEKAVSIGQRYINFQTNHEFRSRHINVDGFDCYVGATIAGYCEDWYRKAVWVLSQVGEPVDHLHPAVPRLYGGESEMWRAMKKELPYWKDSYVRDVECRTVGRLRAKCSAVGIIGDVFHRTNARVRLFVGPWGRKTAVSGYTKVFDEYCYWVRGKSVRACTRWRNLGPVYFWD